MILILSGNGDLSTDIVIDWLEKFGASYLRLNLSNFLDNNFYYEITNDSNVLRLGDKPMDIDLINAVWFRKFGFFRSSNQCKDIDQLTDAYTVGHISTEMSKIINTLSFVLKEKYWLTNPEKINLTKTNVLSIAKRCGFSIPATYLTNNKSELERLLNDKPMISKSVYDPMYAGMRDGKYMMYTTQLTKRDLKYLPNTFLPSMTQEMIAKKQEIRTFYLEGVCYSMSIHSQYDPQTGVDYRKYNISSPNRFIPYKLSIFHEKMVCKLMNELDLNTGSLDFILKEDGTLIFLEVNPTGQFGMVDFPCNYGLHKKVAKLLIEKDGQKIISK